ncbi:cysteine hydrolase family protein [Paenibacillus crassostreae]|uniref:Cysteine hydrolase n=1 Tax=Paenibacillus crassostreae TaxID=1763538 RepID=A0A167DTZ6_9BACL|nr:cysteine hydrolase [Paenibacillus crassostreae]AOZ91067.1 cysteine hydrolase [Paenibacillus crassostreae]OAB74772.1 cysteine hydrolase [Paenibacillus crassostreae]
MRNILENSALLVIDIQNDMESDAIPVMEGGTCMLNSPKIIKHFRELELPIIQVRELHRADLSDFGRELDGVEKIHCLEGTSAEEFHPSTAPIEGEYIITKRRYSAFIGTDLDLLLRCKGIKRVFLIGGLTDVCVRFTAVDAHQHDYYFNVVSDSVIGSSQQAHKMALKNMEYLQTGANMTTEQVLALNWDK